MQRGGHGHIQNLTIQNIVIGVLKSSRVAHQSLLIECNLMKILRQNWNYSQNQIQSWLHQGERSILMYIILIVTTQAAIFLRKGTL